GRNCCVEPGPVGGGRRHGRRIGSHIGSPWPVEESAGGQAETGHRTCSHRSRPVVAAGALPRLRSLTRRRQTPALARSPPVKNRGFSPFIPLFSFQPRCGIPVTPRLIFP